MDSFILKLDSTIGILNIELVPQERKEVLQVLIDYIQKKVDAGKQVKLNFICTHNSRRSQFSQIWAKVASEYYGIDTACFSGGVEVTAFNERAVSAIEKAGFIVEKEGEGNPRYSIYYSNECDPIIAFSKVFDNKENAADEFAAVMTCSHADENCPFIPGAEERIPVRYNDPKAFDDTPQEEEKYNERSFEIATEMFYVFSKIVS